MPTCVHLSVVWIGSVKSQIFVYTVFEQSLHVHIYISSMNFFCLFVCSVFGFSFDIKGKGIYIYQQMLGCMLM